VTLVLLIVILSIFAATAHIKLATIISILLMGTIGLATAPGLQIRIMKYAADAPTLASGTNIAALNIGNAIGAWLGGVALSAGFGYTAPLWVGAALASGALLVLVAGTVLSARSEATPVATRAAT
jgi:DHA1 family inner membrane transport protein